MRILSKTTSASHAYLNEIGRTPLLTPDQEIDLGRKVQRAQALKAEGRELTAGERQEVAIGERAERKFVRCNLRLVVNCAKKYHQMTKSMDLMDLVQEGNLGLITAVQRFDPRMGYKFSTYAYWWIRQGITRAIHYKDRVLRLPGRVGDMAYNWNKVAKLQMELGRAPTTAEMAKVFKVTEDDVLLYLERGAQMSSLDVMMLQGDGTALGELVYDPEQSEMQLEMLDRITQQEEVTRALACLDKREQDVVQRRWGLGEYEPHTLAQISQEMGVSRERIRQILDVSYRRMRVRMARAEAYREMALAG